MDVIGKGGVVSYFWKSLSQTFERELKGAVKGSVVLQQLVQTNYRIYFITLIISESLANVSWIV